MRLGKTSSGSCRNLRIPALAILLAFGWANAQAMVVSFDPQDSPAPGAPEIRFNETVTLDVVASNFMDVSPVDGGRTDGGGINISFDPSIVQAVSFMLSNIWDFPPGNSNGTIDNNAGTISDITFTAFSTRPTTPGFTIGTLTLMTLEQRGTFGLELTESLAIGGFALDGERIEVDFVNGSIAVVPIPAAVWMFVSAVGLLGAAARRRRA